MRTLILFVCVALLPACTAAKPETAPTDSSAEQQTPTADSPCNGPVYEYTPIDEDPNFILVSCSLTTERLMRRWANEFQASHPAAKVEVEATEEATIIARTGAGYGIEFAVLYQSSGGLSDVPDPTQGFHSWPVVVAVDKLEIIVHPDNPVRDLTVDEVAWIYSNQGDSHGFDFDRDDEDPVEQRLNSLLPSQEKTIEEPTKQPLMVRGLAQGSPFLVHTRIDRWRDLDINNPPGDGSLHVYGRERIADDSDFLELRTVGTPTYSLGSTIGVPRMPRDDEAIRIVESPSKMIRAIAADPQGVGYVSHSQVTDQVRTVAVIGEPRKDFWTEQQQIDDAPFQLDLSVLERPVFLWITPSNEQPRTELQVELLKYILSPVAQAIAQEEGFTPLTPELAKRQLEAAIETPNLSRF
ncbi:hypothetical protein LOC68_25920 [Blastopirellula sp. JC732]|uniref:PBP domain-containing protein n=1 Tax=Blastopirellula sediminis TaxID=2894196 RepID=A0A9X1MQW6_9BACT|nr:substrate-binding domain-containing protein [Blastopirellula sediminis]MCC9604853.1 hypothetical protein [Blastopirellula sediminis]MCC9631848.1 hypothetical protein [Blastopirellula sediminis]